MQTETPIKTGALNRSELVRLYVKYKSNRVCGYEFRQCINALDRNDEESYVFWLRHAAIECGHYKPWEGKHEKTIQQ
jgi:hypothetical protein